MNISGTTILAGVIGWPVAHSKSPAMHNAAAADLGLDLVYLPLPVHPDVLESAVPGLAALGFRGVNVTVPHKEAVLPLLDQVHPAAQAIGAVNTIVIPDHQSPPLNPRLIGYNTDWRGFIADLAAQNLKLKRQQCLILGAGGSARAVVYGLASAGNEIHVFARRLKQARRLADDLETYFPKGEFAIHHWDTLVDEGNQFADASLIVNCTPVGMTPNENESPWPEKLAFPGNAFVYDLVYNPTETRLLQEARNAGCRVANGLGMLVRQGALAFQLWTGKNPNLEVMASAIT